MRVDGYNHSKEGYWPHHIQHYSHSTSKNHQKNYRQEYCKNQRCDVSRGLLQESQEPSFDTTTILEILGLIRLEITI